MATAGRKVFGLRVGAGLSICLITLSTVCLLVATPAGFASKRARFATQEEVAQVWVGLSTDGRSLLRLVLSRDGTGWGGQVFLAGEPEVFRIPAWHYERGKITATAQQVGSGGLEIEKLEGSVFGLAMELTLTGRDWEREVALRRESDLEGPWNRLRARMSDLPQSLP